MSVLLVSDFFEKVGLASLGTGRRPCRKRISTRAVQSSSTACDDRILQPDKCNRKAGVEESLLLQCFPNRPAHRQAKAAGVGWIAGEVSEKWILPNTASARTPVGKGAKGRTDERHRVSKS